ncbi:hypothetical protein BCR39DRAFT_557059 [Naematelia encephala]|uniref:LysM domain-containing protein n=1 Tax=Naematelia encephala TaxID=71784 RepID=A0A1Y2BEW0_9TREE|nr:hypothetical protein BCR39DRAFT_557059 [Naematelia encephala]
MLASSSTTKLRRTSSPLDGDAEVSGLANDISSTQITSRDASFLRRRPKQRETSVSEDLHPLAREVELEDEGVSRPALRRLTSETERQVAESSRSAASEGTSRRESLDLLRMSVVENGGEVEVILHQVKATESLPGIALLYGIDLATLRKVNKLWPSDPVHLRTHLYIPLDACRWSKASDTFHRGPGEGQVTLVPKSLSKGKGREGDIRRSMSEGYLDENPLNGYDDRRSVNTARPNATDGRTRVLDIVRIPNSQLRFFPKAQRIEPRRSFDRSRRSTGASIANDLRTLPSPLKPPDPRPKSNMVRLRPPTTQKPLNTSSGIANRLSSLFIVPAPPPPQPYGVGRQASTDIESPRISRRSSNVSTPLPELLELHLRTSDTNGHPVSDRKKSR